MGKHLHGQFPTGTITLKLIEFFNQVGIRKDWRTQYIRYRLGRLKHQYWLWNRKRRGNFLVDKYDYRILQNCQPGNTVFFSSSGYYLKDIWPEIIVVEQFPVVSTFYKDAIICEDRADLPRVLPVLADNFAIVNNRAEMWVTMAGFTDHLSHYVQVMNPGCRVFYSFRDTQIHVNRINTDMEQHFLEWAQSLEDQLNLKLVYHDFDFAKKVPDANGYYDMLENPDTANGNLKFWFVYKGEPWNVL